jgi:hypothetical protein
MKTRIRGITAREMRSNNMTQVTDEDIRLVQLFIDACDMALASLETPFDQGGKKIVYRHAVTWIEEIWAGELAAHYGVRPLPESCNTACCIAGFAAIKNAPRVPQAASSREGWIHNEASLLQRRLGELAEEHYFTDAGSYLTDASSMINNYWNEGVDSDEDTAREIKELLACGLRELKNVQEQQEVEQDATSNNQV